MPSLKNIIYTDEKVAPKDKVNKPAASGVDVYSFEEVVELGQRNPIEFTPPKAKRLPAQLPLSVCPAARQLGCVCGGVLAGRAARRLLMA